MHTMSDQEHIDDDCRGPVLPEPAKEVIVPAVERLITECEIPEEPEPEETAPRRANFSGSGLDGLGGGNIL
jgi:hypothetical protein